MAQYILTGGLGSGKTLMSVMKIQEYLLKGRRIACNFDLNLPKLIGWKKSKVSAYRLPDQPTMQDLTDIGLGSDKRGEENHGLLVLDEASLFLNTQDFRSQAIKDIKEFMIHLRKRRWDIILIVQHYEILDKQIRNILGEHVCRAKRFDRLKIPVITWFFSIFDINVRFPRIHMCDVRYGHAHNAPKVDSWILRGSSLYGAYDTEQAFSSTYGQGLFQFLPPSKLKKPEVTQKTRLPKMKQFFLYLSAVLIGASVTAFTLKQPTEQLKDDNHKARKKAPSPTMEALPLPNGIHIRGSLSIDDDIHYTFQASNSVIYPENYGYTVHSISPCKASIVDPVSRRRAIVRCSFAQEIPSDSFVGNQPPSVNIFGGTDSSESGATNGS
jgi:hypothetical protein